MIVVAGPRSVGKTTYVASWLTQHPDRRILVASRYHAEYYNYLGLEDRVVDIRHQGYLSRGFQYACDNFLELAFHGALARVSVAPSLITVDASEVIRLFPRHIDTGVEINDCKI